MDSPPHEFGWTASEEGVSLYFVVALSLLALVLVLSKLLHDRPNISSLIPEAGMTISVGVAAGFVVFLLAPLAVEEDDYGDGEDEDGSVYGGLLSFSSTVFFIALLPPIIFNSVSVGLSKPDPSFSPLDAFKRRDERADGACSGREGNIFESRTPVTSRRRRQESVLAASRWGAREVFFLLSLVRFRGMLWKTAIHATRYFSEYSRRGGEE